MKIKQVIFIDYSHRLQDSKYLVTKKCLNSHGHTGKITVEFEQDNNRADMILDFSVIKEIVNFYDHKALLKFSDPLYKFLFEEKSEQVIGFDENPTIETLVKKIYQKINNQYSDLVNLKVSGVEGYKGPDSPIVEYAPKIVKYDPTK